MHVSNRKKTKTKNRRCTKTRKQETSPFNFFCWSRLLISFDWQFLILQHSLCLVFGSNKRAQASTELHDSQWAPLRRVITHGTFSMYIDECLIYHSTHTFWDHSMGQADVSLGVMRLYQKDLAEQCWIGWDKSGFQLSPYFMLGNLKRRLKAPKFWVGNPLFVCRTVWS